MECFSFRKDVDIEGQGPKNDGTGSEKKKASTGMKKIISDTTKFISETPAWLIHLSRWDVVFLGVCVVAVAADPLFFYVPVINQGLATKCIMIDNTLKIVAICVRSFLDLVALGDLVARKRKINKCPQMKRSDYVINIISILPVNQVLMPIVFSEMRDSKTGHIGKLLNAIVVLQYVPRVLRIYRLWKIVNENMLPKRESDLEVNNADSYRQNHHVMIPPKSFIVMKGGFNLLLYLLASHALGAFWYFFSIQRETICWRLACVHDPPCSNNFSLNCGSIQGFKNYTFLNDFCSIEKPNTTFVDFGIFQVARQSGILESKDFPRKTMFCFWWGLRHLSSMGQNLETSSDYWENCFAVIISIFGLLLFLYFIGNLQVYMQETASKELKEIISTWSERRQAKLLSIEDWIKTIELSDEQKEQIMRDVQQKLVEDQTNRIDKKNPFPDLPEDLKRLIKRSLCLPRLRRLPIFENEKEELLHRISNKHLNQVLYNENRFIARMGKPLKGMIFVVKGHVCTSNDHGNNIDECSDRCDLIGEHDIVKWVQESPRQSSHPISTRTLKCHTKVEAFHLKAEDLKVIYDARRNSASSETSHDSGCYGSGCM